MSLRGPAARLFLISFLTLFIELGLIRFLPGNVRVLSYFTNLVLLASFWGIGLGAMLSRARRDLFLLFPAALLAVFGLMTYFTSVEILPARFLASGEYLWLQYQNLGHEAARWPLVPVLLLFFGGVSLVFLPLGQALGRALQPLPPIRAYSIDIAGSLSGTVLFAGLSLTSAPPSVWFGLGLVVSALVVAPSRWRTVVTVGLFLPILWVSVHGSGSAEWSPYYKIEAEPTSDHILDVFVNESFHQSMVDLRPSSVEQNPQVKGLADRLRAPYTLFASPPTRVLILGAGTGNDVAVALTSGAGHVDAVEIDPIILDIGRRDNPTGCYQDPRVSVHVGDARNFLAGTDRRYDLVVFGTLDSQTRLAGVSGLRLDNYVYTVESLRAVAALLTDDGLVALNFSVARPWIRDKITDMVRAVFGEGFRKIVWGDGWLFDTTFLAGPRLNPRGSERLAGGGAAGPAVTATTPTDDWPFLYLRQRALPAFTLQVIVVLLVVTALLPYLLLRGRFRSRLAAGEGSPGYAPFFFLGVAFLLLETRSVTEVALVYGSTWVVNAVVFSSIFCVILLANLTAHRSQRNLTGVAMLGLLASLLANFLIPVRTLLGGWPTLQVIAVVLFVGAPIYFAGILFASFFRAVPNRDYAFGLNLIGAMIGGMLEHASVYLGFKALSLVALALYIAAYAAARRSGGR